MKDYPLDRRCDTFTQERFVMSEALATAELTINGKRYLHAWNIDRLVAEKLQSINSCDDAFVAMVTGEVVKGSEKERLLIQARRAHVRRIFTTLGDAIADALESSDKVNGYQKGKLDQWASERMDETVVRALAGELSKDTANDKVDGYDKD